MGITAATMAVHLKGQAKVMAFEPVPETARRAAATFALNQLENVRLFQMAVGDVEGETTFYSSLEDSDSATIHPTQENIQWISIRVPCRSLDSLRYDNKIPDARMIKIDVEGHEPQAIRGGCQLFRETAPEILYEYHSGIAQKIGWSPADITHLMQQWRPYEFKKLAENGSLSDLVVDSIRKVANIYGALPESSVESGSRERNPFSADSIKKA